MQYCKTSAAKFELRSQGIRKEKDIYANLMIPFANRLAVSKVASGLSIFHGCIGSLSAQELKFLCTGRIVMLSGGSGLLVWLLLNLCMKPPDRLSWTRFALQTWEHPQDHLGFLSATCGLILHTPSSLHRPIEKLYPIWASKASLMTFGIEELCLICSQHSGLGNTCLSCIYHGSQILSPMFECLKHWSIYRTYTAYVLLKF